MLFERFERVSKLLLYRSCSCALFFACVRVVAVIVLWCVHSFSPLTPILILITCVRRERLQRVEISNKRESYKEDKSDTQV
jgi:hypothetical protein